MATRPPTIDRYAPLSHKEAIGPTDIEPRSLAPTWVPRSELRRLNSYIIRAAYGLNVARYLARAETTTIGGESQIINGRLFQSGGTVVDTDDLEDRREYGDAALLVDRVVAGVLGDTFEIVVDGADDDLPDEPELPDEPAPLPNPTEIQRRVHEIRSRMWSDTVDSILTEWERAWAEQPALLDRQQWLRDWVDDELVASKIVEAEQDICGLGDGVYVLAWSNLKGRPILDVYDPGHYFPVLDDRTRDFPTKAHIAWEYEEEEGKDLVKWVRRLTWELAPITTMLDDNDGPLFDDSNRMRLRDPVRLADTANLVDRFATRKDIAGGIAAGSVVRDYPWNVDDDGKPVPSNLTCYFTDARWKIKDLGPLNMLDFTEADAVFATNEDGLVIKRLDLHHDFLPIVHVPNTPASREHFGTSVIDLVAQILDDIQIGDTNIQEAAALAAGPVLHSSGQKNAEKIAVRPGTVLNGGENSRMDVLDMSKGLKELRDTQESRLDRLSVNGRVPAEVLGRDRGAGNASSSGFHELLRFGPFIQLIGKLRMTREPKARLLLKLVQRLGQLGGVLPAGANPPAHIAFGSFLPSDRAQLVKEATELLKAKAISTQTAVQQLVAGGFTIGDARGEVQRIYAENTEAARQLADATGSEQLAAARLGLELPEREVAPTRTTVIPPTPPVEP